MGSRESLCWKDKYGLASIASDASINNWDKVCFFDYAAPNEFFNPFKRKKIDDLKKTHSAQRILQCVYHFLQVAV
jgi:hypothetical protein